MVLRLKTRESRSLPGLLKAINNLLKTIFGPSRQRAALKAALLFDKAKI